jgi:hypothetical protein
VTQAIGLAVFAALAGGVWLLIHVPGEGATRAADARHPLTRAGRTPVREQPAGRGNRAALLVFWALALIAAAGYIATGAAATVVAFGASVGVVAGAGLLCLALGGLVTAGRVPVPAWSWVRTPIRRGAPPQGLAIALFGLALLGWALLGAAGQGYAWGFLGLVALVLASVLLAPLARRWPAGQERRPGSAEETWGGASRRETSER